MENNWLQSLKKSRSLKILCGAGISLNSGIPLANQYLKYLFTSVGFNTQDADRIIDYNLPFEYWLELFSNSDTYNKYSLLDIFSSGELLPSINHHFIATLIIKGIVNEVYTTNFDLLIEKALHQHGFQKNKDYVVLCQEKDFVNIEDCKLPKLIKLHGSADNYSSIRIVLKEISQERNVEYRRNAVKKMVSGENEDCLLVLGYSFSDVFDIVPSLEELHELHCKIVIVEHTSQSETTVNELGKNWPRQSNGLYTGLKIQGDTDKVVSEIINSYNLSINIDKCSHSDAMTLMKKNVAPFFEKLHDDISDYNHSVYIQAFILHRIGAYVDSNNLIKAYTNQRFDPLTHARLQHLNAQNLQSLGMYREAIEVFASELNSKITQLLVLSGNGNFLKILELSRNKEYQSTIEFLLTQNISVGFQNELEDIASAYFHICTCFIELTNSEDAISNFKTLKKFAEHFSFISEKTSLKASILNSEAIAYGKLGRFDESINMLEESYQMNKKNGDLISLGSNLHNMCAVYFQMNKISEAKKTGEKALELREKINIFPHIFDTLILLIHLEIDTSNVRKIEEYLYKSKIYIKKEPQFRHRLEDIIIVLIEKCKEDPSKYGNSFDILLDLMDKDFSEKTKIIIKDFGEALLRNGEILGQKKLIKEAFNSYKTAIYIFQNIGFYEGITGAMRCIGILYENSNDMDNALKYYQKALDYTNYNCEQKAFTLAQIGVYYSRIGDTTEANKFMQYAFNMVIDLLNTNSSKSTSNLERLKSYINKQSYFIENI